MLEELKHPNFSPLALDILRDRYLWRDAEGNITETPQEMLIRVAKHVASTEKPEGRTYWTSKYYAIMADLDFLPNSPTLMNAGRAYPHGQLAACFVVGIEDSMESICGALRKQMLIHKTGGGTGFNFSKLRPKGANVNSTNGKASGPVSFMRLFDLSTEVVQQGGCFTGDTLIATAEGPVKISELKEGMLVYSHHPEKGFVLTPCTAPFMTRRDTQIMELETDNGLKIRATPDHPFMYRSGFAFREKGFGKLCDLPIGTPLTPLTTYVKKGYRFIALQDGKDNRMPLHRWLAEQGGKSGSVIHHINDNCLDNHLSNLTNEFDNSGHATQHNNERIANDTHVFQHLTPEQRAKAKCGYSKWYAGLAEEEKQKLKDKNAAALRIENQKRMEAGTHNFAGGRHPSKDPTIHAKQRKGRLANILWYLQSLGHRPTADNIEQLEKEAGLYNTLRYKLASYVKEFGSFDKALAYADARNCKVAAKSPCGHADVWNVEIPETHNYVVCNADGTAGVVVSNTRRGANMAILNCDHPDIEEFISCKDEEGKITNFNLSVGLTDEFMKRACDDPTSSAAALLRKIAEHAWKSGDPGVVFFDAINRDNLCPSLGKIEATNPCVTGDTPILTDNGYIRIEECDGKAVDVWNGTEFSLVTPHITGNNNEVMTIYFSDGSELRCTPYHKFHIQPKYARSKSRVLEAKDLKIGDKLVKTEYPVILGGKDSITSEQAYLNGFFTGDGTETAAGRKQLRLYGEKRALLDVFKAYGSVGDVTRNPINIELTKAEGLYSKYWLPYKETVLNRVAWLAGLIDADGNRNSKEGSVVITSIHRDFLLNIRLMLNTLGVPAHVLPLKDECVKEMPNGKNGKQKYHCQKSYRLSISAANVIKLQRLGMKTRRVDLTDITPDRDAGRFVRVVKIKRTGEMADKVYCFNEPLNHTGIFNGLLTGNCGESPLLANEACNLGSVNLAHMVKGGGVDWGKLTYTVETAVRFLDDVIDVSQYPLPEIEEAVKKTRKIGLGVMGWADMLYQLRIPYDSDEAEALADDVITYISDAAWTASQRLALEKGSCPALRGMKQDREWRNATVTCIAPTGTLSLLANCSSSIEPIFANYHTRRVTLGDGTVVEKEIFNPHYEALVADPTLTTEQIDDIAKTAYQINWERHIAHQTAFQLHTDLAVSKTINMPHDATVADVAAAYVAAWIQGCKGTTIYRDGSRSSQVLTEAPVRCKECEI